MIEAACMGRVMERSFPIPANTVGKSKTEATPPGTPPEPPSPESQALSDTLMPLVRHDEAEQLALNSLLFNACADHDVNLIKEAVESGADPKCFVTHPDGLEKGRIPVLAYASMLGKADLVACLLEHEATATFWMLQDALVPEREAVFRAFAEHIEIDTPDPGDGSTMLHWACSNANLWAVDLLIELGADVTERKRDGSTCLILTIEHHGVDRQQQLDIIKALLAAGADIEARFEGVGPLACACLTDNVEAVSLLLAHGANANTRVGRNALPLHLCCEAQVSVEI